MLNLQPGKWAVVSSILSGVLYGISLRLLANLHHSVMTLAFVLLGPFAMGFVTIWVAERKQRQSVATWIILPWITFFLAMIGMLVTLLEGMICVVMLLPIGLLLTSLGGLLAGLIVRGLPSVRPQGLPVMVVMVLPMLVGLMERRYLERNEFRTVETIIDIHAAPETVWRNIERVREIHPAELQHSWTSRIGFPRPEEATLSFEGVGAVRHASFAGGVVFLETVDVWEPQHTLSFSIHVDQMPSKTLDEHVQVGGAYFDVLRGEYRLEPLTGGVTRLHLSSQHRLSTDFNWYAHLWTDRIMADIQGNILQVIKNRCEQEQREQKP